LVPGKGALTKELIKKEIEQILVIEKDDRLINNLKIFSKEFKNLKVIHQDALKIDYNKIIKKNSIIVGNLPFNISSNLLMNWISLNKWPRSIIKCILCFKKKLLNVFWLKMELKNMEDYLLLLNLDV
jgi:16S rRNA (adenine1518-N6/adenine1519-N6)-dimethyltransferase